MTIALFVTDLIKGLLRWPFWWYSSGLVLAIGSARTAVSDYAKMLGIGVWMKNIFVPMYGTSDWQSRLISIFMRTVQIVGRSIALASWVFVVLMLLVLYVALPVLSFAMLMFHLTVFVT